MSRKVSLTHQIGFWQMLSHLSQANIPLHQALEISKTTVESPPLSQALTRIQSDLVGGMLFSQSLSNHADLNSSFNVQMAKLAEKTGDYGRSCLLISQHIQWRRSWQQLIQQSLRYPIILMLLLGVLLSIIILLVLPGLLEQLSLLGIQEIPFATKALIFLGQYPLELLEGIGGFSCIILGWRWNRHRRDLKPWRYRIPHLGRVLYQLQILQFLHGLGTMLTAKVDGLTSLYQAAQIPNCTWLKKQLQDREQHLISGRNFSSALVGILPVWSATANLIPVGEATGRLGELLVSSCETELQHLQTKIRDWLDFLQPALVMVMGLIMIWVVLAVLLPLYDSVGKFHA